MAYGFVIDQGKCIGCHACTVACKAENDVPVGSFRTWVKYVEKGTFPSVRRHFTVLRCNHCDAAPCVEICPVVALGKRKDAIVDLDRDVCIGCRACMQACPYDALYLNEDRGVAEKCHYCAHRTEIGLEPACVNVCPVQAIVSGDVDDPGSRIATLLREQPTSRRKLDKGTRPRVWYVDALPEALVPGVPAEPASYLWSDRSPGDAPPPIVPGFEPTPDITATLDVPHPPVWGWHVSAYLVTKNVAAGAALFAPLFPAIATWLLGIALVFLAVTNVLLVLDLGRPERFLKILFHPNTRSWLVKGAWILTAFGIVTTLALALRLLGIAAPAGILAWANVPIAVLTAGYSAWLFAQCRGRDLWIQPGLFALLSVRAVLLGAGAALLCLPDARRTVLAFVGAALASALAHFVEAKGRPATRDGALAHAILERELGTAPTWMLYLVVATLGVLARLQLPSWPVAAAAVALAVYATYRHEDAWIRAGHAVPLS